MAVSVDLVNGTSWKCLTVLATVLVIGSVVAEFDIDYDNAVTNVVNTTYGPILGFTMPLVANGSVHFAAYVGIPYAKPPVGSLRWKPPEDMNPWNESNVYNATYFRPCCMQILDNIREWSMGPEYNNTSEDCLYLNVFTVNDTQALKPVMVWIHGGSFRYGSGEEYDARILSQQGVVVVTLNYRLGLFGFLSTDDDSARGNYGMLDMVAALRWVRDNIGIFGGDKDSVTVFGNSAGGAAVSLLMFSPLTTGLIHRVVAQSGDALSKWAIYRPPYKNLPCAVTLATAVGCSADTTTAEMLNCLRGKDATLLLSAEVSGCASPFNANWAPRIDDYFISATPEELLANKNFHTVDFFGGTVPDEVSDEYPDVPDIEIGFSREDKEQRMYRWSRRYNEWADMMYSAVAHEYDLPGNNYSEHRDLYIEMRSDFEYIAPHDAHASGHSLVVNNTFLYSFEYRSDNIPTPEWMGVPHSEECYYIFGTPFWPPANDSNCPWGCHNVVWRSRQDVWDEYDKDMSRKMMIAWAHFAKVGYPLVNGTFGWPRFDVDTQPYVAINKEWTVDNYYKYRRVQFWNSLVISILGTTLDTCSDDITTTLGPVNAGCRSAPYLTNLFLIVLFGACLGQCYSRLKF